MPDPAFRRMTPDQKFDHLASWCENLSGKLAQAQKEIAELQQRLEAQAGSRGKGPDA
jgi:hypothetical protein